MNCRKCNTPEPQHQLRDGLCLQCLFNERNDLIAYIKKCKEMIPVCESELLAVRIARLQANHHNLQQQLKDYQP